MTSIASTRLELGTTLQERYRVLQFIGRGGMGAVYSCEDLRLPGKKWALKEMILHDPGVAEQVRDSFTREARFLAGLRHRSLPSIVDVFSHANRQYLVMEFIEGETLAQRIESQGIPSDTVALSWALELAQVLDYLHRQERPIIFRDLKPENIMINLEGHVKVIDFGLARHFEPGKRRDTQASGTVGYAPPEQWEDSGQSDPRSDIYALAATLYFVLTGRPPSPIYGSHRIRPYRPDIDPGIEALVLRCLQPDPSQRYSSAAELIKDLLILLSDDKHQGAIRLEHAPNRESLPRATRSTKMEKLPNMRPPVGFPKRLPSTLGVGLVLFLVGLLLPWVNLERASQREGGTQDKISEILIQTDPVKDQAKKLVEQGKYKEAIALLDSIFTRFPEDPESLILKNNAYAAFSGLETYKIPVLSSWHGAEREGIQILYGLALAQTQLNRNRIGKSPLVELLLFDDRSNNENLLSIASELTSNEDYPLIIGPFTSQQTRLIAPLANGKGLPVVAPIASDPQIFSTGQYIFSAADPDTTKIQAIASYLYDQGHRRVAILTDSSSIISRGWGETFLETFQDKGGRIALVEEYPNNLVDFRELVGEARQKEADCIFMAEYRIPPVINLCESLVDANWRPTVAAQTAVFSDSLFRRGESTVEGLYLSTYYVPDITGGQEGKDFSREFRQTFGGHRPTHREANSYDTLKLVVETLDAVGTDREKVKDYLASYGTQAREAYQGLSGRFALDSALGARKSYIIKVEQGAYKVVDVGQP